MAFVEVADATEIPTGTIKSIKANDNEIIVVNYQANYYAIAQKCTHMGGNLSKGKLEGNIITCPLHGSKFDVTNGKCVQGPKIGFIKSKTGDIRTYPVKIENGKIKIDV